MRTELNTYQAPDCATLRVIISLESRAVAQVLLMPLGFICCFRPLTDGKLFLVLYGVTAVYFSGVMVRLMLVLAPAACCLAAVAAHEILGSLCAGVVGVPAADTQSDSGCAFCLCPGNKRRQSACRACECNVPQRNSHCVTLSM